MNKTFHFRGRYVNDTGVVKLGHYSDGSFALRLVSSLGEPLTTATVNLQDYGEKPAEGHVFIKLHGEHEGLCENLQEHGIVGPPIRAVRFGFSMASECELLLSPEDARLL